MQCETFWTTLEVHEESHHTALPMPPLWSAPDPGVPGVQLQWSQPPCLKSLFCFPTRSGHALLGLESSGLSSGRSSTRRSFSHNPRLPAAPTPWRPQPWGKPVQESRDRLPRLTARARRGTTRPSLSAHRPGLRGARRAPPRSARTRAAGRSTHLRRAHGPGHLGGDTSDNQALRKLSGLGNHGACQEDTGSPAPRGAHAPEQLRRSFHRLSSRVQRKDFWETESPRRSSCASATWSRLSW
ncbi:PREDICTED: uncharacterized protein LOC102024178 [Chinchilla lanigera]|uniref:uncharacterized protein LOC102024178 n=1 Tax=Chinchilla lanigera TaxID=34839 RepID=UPI00038E9D2A|nr:PREDICTED: uncharacterized protein LOC102024178 [Chinchilla lanigera]